MGKIKMKGFTLIELLVVVLIIGIFAAVALPQYQKAVEKSRVANRYPLLKSLITAEEAYFAANGTYTCDFSQLDINVNFGETFVDGYFSGQRKDGLTLGCLSVGSWYAIRYGDYDKGKYPVYIQYSLNASGTTAHAGWYCVERPLTSAVPCQKLLGLPASSQVIANWFGRWYKMDVQ